MYDESMSNNRRRVGFRYATSLTPRNTDGLVYQLILHQLVVLAGTTVVSSICFVNEKARTALPDRGRGSDV
jgi:hypothetical protein